MKEFEPDQQPDYYFSFGYLQGIAMTALLEKAVELGDLSREGLMKASDELGTVSFEGLSGDYQYGPAESRNPSRMSTIYEVKPDQPFGLGHARVPVRVRGRQGVRVPEGRLLNTGRNGKEGR